MKKIILGNDAYSNFGENVLNPTRYNCRPPPPVDIYLGGLNIRSITSLKRGIYLRDLGGLSFVYFVHLYSFFSLSSTLIT
ncbi:hypothetical protein ACN38_g1144 [Penicillium nordicum]|uniref:Uncharacterized protein n=1 Tax=Penicillium nordicum TaxID=229535 RepID=A0A0M8PGQ6_9EURO|nr:hypothetical protein ACN38_g1144 [Penicillium nordicum]